MFQKSSTANNNNAGHGQTVDLASTKLNALHGGGSNVLRLNGSEKFRRTSKGHVHDGSNGCNNA